MKSKRLIALAMALVLLCSVCSAFAASAGTSDDPLLSRSYLSAWSEEQVQTAVSAVDTAIRAAQRSARVEANRILSVTANNGVRMETLPSGASVALKTGDFVTLTGGSATVRIQSGMLVDATTGQTVSSGNVEAYHRYIACEDLSAVLTCTAQETALMMSGTAIVSRFLDVTPTLWYGSAVDYVTTHALMLGMGDMAFYPSYTLSRAMFVTMLGRLSGVDESGYPGSSFSDTPAGQWYSPYVEWGVQAGIVTGMGDNQFEPDAPVTREQMATFIARYAAYTGLTLSQICVTPAVFQDQSSVSGWAEAGVELMRQTGILRGDETGCFHPRNSATRAEAATVFMRLCGAMSLT